MLFNEPKLLKYNVSGLYNALLAIGFSALQRAEIAEMLAGFRQRRAPHRFSALQRAEIAEMLTPVGNVSV